MGLESTQKVAVVGGGILGRLCSYFLLKGGKSVSLFEKNGPLPSTNESCSLTAAGMIAPYCELEYCEDIVADLGVLSLELWPSIVKDFGEKVFFQQNGGLCVAHPQDKNELNRLENSIHQYALKKGKEKKDFFQKVSGNEFQKLEPELTSRFSHGLYFPLEAQISPKSIFESFNELFLPQIQNHFFTEVLKIDSQKVVTNKGEFQFDFIIDCRGLDGKADFLLDTDHSLRGVRGEVIVVKTNEVNLNRPIRLIHPRYPIYVVPRPDNQFVIGATSIESEDKGPISVKSTLELLSAVYSLHSGFSEAKIIETRVNLRPTTFSHTPFILKNKNVFKLNGLYRHGYLLAPALSKIMMEIIDGKKDTQYSTIIREN